MSGHRKKPTDRGALTTWRRQREGLVKTWKETDRPTEAHSHPGDGRGRDLSGHGKNPTDQGALTPWRQQKEGLVRTRKEIDRAAGMGTYILENVDGRAS